MLKYTFLAGSEQTFLRVFAGLCGFCGLNRLNREIIKLAQDTR